MTFFIELSNEQQVFQTHFLKIIFFTTQKFKNEGNFTEKHVFLLFYFYFLYFNYKIIFISLLFKIKVENKVIFIHLNIAPFIAL